MTSAPDGTEAARDGAAGPVDHRVAIVGERGGLRLERGVGDDRRGADVAEQLVAGLAERLAAEVVQRDVERADRVDDGAAAAVHRRADVEALPQRLDVQQVGAEQQLLQAEAHVVGPGRLDAGACDPGVDVGLADAADPLVGVDLDDDVVLRGAGGRRVERRLHEDVAVDAGDAQDTVPFARRRSLRPAGGSGASCVPLRAWPRGGPVIYLSDDLRFVRNLSPIVDNVNREPKRVISR